MTTKLLAVDDSKTMRKVLEITFAGKTYDSTVVGSAEEALASLKSNPPQLVVVDGHLGGTSGYDLCQQIKSVAPQVKVVLLSSKQRPFDAAKAAAVGVDDHFDKPFDSTKFLDKLGQIDLDAASATPLATGSQAAASSPSAAPQPVISKPITAMPVAVKPVVAQPVAAVPVSVTPLGSRPAAPPLSPASGPAIAQSRPATAPDLGALKSGPAPVVSKPAASSSAAVPPSTAAASPLTAGSSPSAAASKAAVPSATAAALNGNMSAKLSQLGLTNDQIQGVLALSREVVEQVVWEVVPHLAETLIKEEIARLTSE